MKATPNREENPFLEAKLHEQRKDEKKEEDKKFSSNSIIRKLNQEANFPTSHECPTLVEFSVSLIDAIINPE